MSNYPFSQRVLDSSGFDAVAVTPSDTADLPNFARMLYVGAAGNIAVEMVDARAGTVVVFAAVPAGTILPVAVRRVRATGTTAGSIVALW